MKILFLSSDTGGGHRASAESLAKQFQLLFPGATYDLLDIVDGLLPPYNKLVSLYKHLSARPSQWKLLYNVSNSRTFEVLVDANFKLMCERAVRKSIQSYDPDVVISVHPLMNNVPVVSCAKISHETARHLPIFTVVTDLGSAHCLWFSPNVERVFVGSEQVRELARERGGVPDDKLELVGLPIRHDFAVQADNMGNRMSAEGLAYQRRIRADLGLADRKTLLVMGGGEGVGSLSNIVNALYVELLSQDIEALILVVCGRNEKLKESLENRDWRQVVNQWNAVKERRELAGSIYSVDDICGSTLSSPGCIKGGSLRNMLSKGSLAGSPVSVPLPVMHFDDAHSPVKSLTPKARNVEVVGLGFVERMAEYMVATDVLVTKAGPGTISEAAALSLPVMLTSFLPGQEEGNVDFVVDGGFGAFSHHSDPIAMAEEVCMWLTNDEKRSELSRAAGKMGAPNAARDIAKAIGESTWKWIELNGERAHEGSS